MNRRNLAIAASTITFGSAIGLITTGGWLISEAALRPPILVLQVAIVSVRAFGIMRGSFRWVERVVSHDAALDETVHRRAKLWDDLALAGPRGAWSLRRGDAITRLMQDAEIMQDRVTRVVVPATAAIITGIGAVAVQTALLPMAGILFMVALVVSGIVVPRLLRGIEQSAADEALVIRADLNSRISEFIDHRDDFRMLGIIEEAIDEISKIDADRLAIETRAARLSGVTQLLALLASGFGILAGLIVAIPAVFDGTLQGPHLAVVALLPWSAGEVITALSAAATAQVRVRAAQRRLAAVENLPREVPMLQAGERLELHDIHVRYDDVDVVAHVALVVNAGERVALVGPSGSGKSTVAAAVLGLIGYRGTISAPHVTAIRSTSVAAVLQSTHTFATTVRENLRLVVPVEDEHLHDVLDRVGLRVALDRNLGLEPLSGGERQRLGLARALLTDAPFLVLDEPTEHLDDETSALVMASILQASRERGILMTSHRLADLEGFDRIYVLDGGRIVSEGTFSECVKNNEWFRDSVQWHLDKQRVL